LLCYPCPFSSASEGLKAVRLGGAGWWGIVWTCSVERFSYAAQVADADLAGTPEINLWELACLR